MGLKSSVSKQQVECHKDAWMPNVFESETNKFVVNTMRVYQETDGYAIYLVTPTKKVTKLTTEIATR